MEHVADGQGIPAAERHGLAGRVIAGKYYLDAYIGRGSSGAVYRARHSVLEKPLALKILDPELAHSPALVELFKREAKAASRIDHVNSVRVLDFGEDASGLLYIAMEFVEGPDLFQLLDEHFPLPAERVIEIMTQVLAALSVAHELGVIHRDLKPENILVLSGLNDEGRPSDLIKVCDFGVAQLCPAGVPAQPRPAPSTTAPPAIDIARLVGTPEYMSPEQARCEPLDARSDVYSAGIVLYQLLTGCLPFMADTPEAVAAMQCTEPPPPPSSLAYVDARLEAICLTAIHKDPERRYQSAREMRSALRRAAQLGQAEALVLQGASSTLLAYPLAGPLQTPPPPTITLGLAAAPDPESVDPPPSLPARSHSRFGSRRAAVAFASLLAPALAAAVLAFAPARGRELARRPQTASAPPTTTFTATTSAAAAAPSEQLLAAHVMRPSEPAEPSREPALAATERPRRDVRASREARLARAAALREERVEPMPKPIPEPAPPEAVALPSAAAAPEPTPVSELAPLPYTPPTSSAAANPTAVRPAPVIQQRARPSAPSTTVVRIRDVSVRGPLAPSVVRRAIDRARPDLSACYARSARAAGRSAPEAVAVELEFDERGRARRPHAKGASLPELDRCVSEVASALAIDQAPDTGLVRASWRVAFELDSR